MYEQSQALVSASLGTQLLSDQVFADFLTNIFDQSIEKPIAGIEAGGEKEGKAVKRNGAKPHLHGLKKIRNKWRAFCRKMICATKRK